MEDNQTNNQILRLFAVVIGILLAACLAAALVLLIATLASPGGDPPAPAETTDSETEPPVPVNVLMGETPDAGVAYLDRMIFFGESTTSHLKSRGVLTGGTETKQVWTDSSNTKTLNSQLLSGTIIYPPTGENLTIPEAAAAQQPEYMVLSFGLNGIAGFLSNKDSYLRNYNNLIRAIQTASPETKIILQTIYPVTVNCDRFNEGINEKIEILNEWLQEIAAANQNVRVVDTASVLKDPDGNLIEAYAMEDGYHLTAAAYEQILLYLRTHAWQES